MMQLLAGKQKSAEKGHINTSKILMLALPGVKQYIERYDHLHATERQEPIPTIMISTNAPQRECAQHSITFVRKLFDLYRLLETIHTLLA